MWGFGFRVEGVGFRVQGLGHMGHLKRFLLGILSECIGDEDRTFMRFGARPSQGRSRFRALLWGKAGGRFL